MTAPAIQAALEKAGPRFKVEAALLDAADGEAGIVEVYSGRVLARFGSLRSAAATLRCNRPKYEADGFVAAAVEMAREGRDA